jgi:hypothetical protein
VKYHPISLQTNIKKQKNKGLHTQKYENEHKKNKQEISLLKKSRNKIYFKYKIETFSNAFHCSLFTMKSIKGWVELVLMSRLEHTWRLICETTYEASCASSWGTVKVDDFTNPSTSVGGAPWASDKFTN